jgi:hypothetical protein
MSHQDRLPEQYLCISSNWQPLIHGSWGIPFENAFGSSSLYISRYFSTVDRSLVSFLMNSVILIYYHLLSFSEDRAMQANLCGSHLKPGKQYQWEALSESV